MIIKKNLNKKGKQNRARTSWRYVLGKVSFWLFFLGFWTVAIWTILFSDAMRIEEIIVYSNRADVVEVESIAKRAIEGCYFGALPRNNLLIVPNRRIEREVKKSFIFVRDVKVTRSFPKKITVNVEERESHIMWCNLSKCMLVDERAETFFDIEKGKMKTTEDVMVVVDKSDKELDIGTQVANPTFIKFCEELPVVLEKRMGIEIDKTLITPSSMSEEVRVATKEGWRLLLSTNRPIETQGGIARKILEESISKEDIERLEYIDVRIKGKATFKLRQNKEDKSEENEDEKSDDKKE